MFRYLVGLNNISAHCGDHHSVMLQQYKKSTTYQFQEGVQHKFTYSTTHKQLGLYIHATVKLGLLGCIYIFLSHRI